MIVDVLPDDDQDRISDTGRRARWWLTADGGVVWTHLGNDFSERQRLGSEGEGRAAELIADRDGDFVGDLDDDMPVEGALPCPGFSHDDLFAEGSEHQDFLCERCHTETDPIPLACHDCHSAFGRVADEVPEAVPMDHFEKRCEQCHVANRDWDAQPGPDGPKHETFLLIGHHLRTDCFSCHQAGDPKPRSVCAECHFEDRTPDHFEDTCEICHTPADWKPPIARHDDFPLAGGHEGVDCAECHTPPEYTNTSTVCDGCHLDDAPPRHVPAGFLDVRSGCDTCHVIDAWPNHRYQHPHWALRGRHADLLCADCHGTDDAVPYGTLDTDCRACHTPPIFPDHSGASFDDCRQCHLETGWVPAETGSIDHSIFPLTGAHQTALCSTCHENGTVANPPTSCAACHEMERPARHSGFFDGDCEGCHQSTTWAELPTPYEHTPTFPLEGIHLTTACSNCHTGATYDAPTDCIGCHLPERPPNHYGDFCDECHTTSNWNPTGSLDHHSVDPTAFPLTLGHANILCSACHTNGFGPLPRNCEACHLTDQPAGHATDACATCHEAGGWTQPRQPPAGTIHPLAGQHVGRSCVSCHGTYTNGVGFATPAPNAACATCHNLPTNHFAVGTTDCGTCHTVAGWLPAAGGHGGPLPTTPFPFDTWTNNTWFPSNHRNVRQCDECHTLPGDYRFFSCSTNSRCHDNQNGLNDDHNNGQDDGTDPDKQFHLYHFDPNATHSPANEGGGPWRTAHTGCVNRHCHADGRKP
jgi:hypothetical protein